MIWKSAVSLANKFIMNTILMKFRTMKEGMSHKEIN